MASKDQGHWQRGLVSIGKELGYLARNIKSIDAMLARVTCPEKILVFVQ